MLGASREKRRRADVPAYAYCGYGETKLLPYVTANRQMSVSQHGAEQTFQPRRGDKSNCVAGRVLSISGAERCPNIEPGRRSESRHDHRLLTPLRGISTSVRDLEYSDESALPKIVLARIRPDVSTIPSVPVAGIPPAVGFLSGTTTASVHPIRRSEATRMGTLSDLPTYMTSSHPGQASRRSFSQLNGIARQPLGTSTQFHGPTGFTFSPPPLLNHLRTTSGSYYRSSLVAGVPTSSCFQVGSHGPPDIVKNTLVNNSGRFIQDRPARSRNDVANCPQPMHLYHSQPDHRRIISSRTADQPSYFTTVLHQPPALAGYIRLPTQTKTPEVHQGFASQGHGEDPGRFFSMPGSCSLAGLPVVQDYPDVSDQTQHMNQSIHQTDNVHPDPLRSQSLLEPELKTSGAARPDNLPGHLLCCADNLRPCVLDRPKKIKASRPPHIPSIPNRIIPPGGERRTFHASQFLRNAAKDSPSGGNALLHYGQFPNANLENINQIETLGLDSRNAALQSSAVASREIGGAQESGFGHVRRSSESRLVSYFNYAPWMDRYRTTDSNDTNQCYRLPAGQRLDSIGFPLRVRSSFTGGFMQSMPIAPVLHARSKSCDNFSRISSFQNIRTGYAPSVGDTPFTLDSSLPPAMMLVPPNLPPRVPSPVVQEALPAEPDGQASFSAYAASETNQDEVSLSQSRQATKNEVVTPMSPDLEIESLPDRELKGSSVETVTPRHQKALLRQPQQDCIPGAFPSKQGHQLASCEGRMAVSSADDTRLNGSPSSITSLSRIANNDSGHIQNRCRSCSRCSYASMESGSGCAHCSKTSRRIHWLENAVELLSSFLLTLLRTAHVDSADELIKILKSINKETQSAKSPNPLKQKLKQSEYLDPFPDGMTESSLSMPVNTSELMNLTPTNSSAICSEEESNASRSKSHISSLPLLNSRHSQGQGKRQDGESQPPGKSAAELLAALKLMEDALGKLESSSRGFNLEEVDTTDAARENDGEGIGGIHVDQDEDHSGCENPYSCSLSFNHVGAGQKGGDIGENGLPVASGKKMGEIAQGNDWTAGTEDAFDEISEGSGTVQDKNYYSSEESQNDTKTDDEGKDNNEVRNASESKDSEHRTSGSLSKSSDVVIGHGFAIRIRKQNPQSTRDEDKSGMNRMVPNLALKEVGAGGWLTGQQTAGDTYAAANALDA